MDYRSTVSLPSVESTTVDAGGNWSVSPSPEQHELLTHGMRLDVTQENAAGVVSTPVETIIQLNEPTIEIVESELPVGERQTVIGRNCIPCETVNGILFSTPVDLGAHTADASGEVAFSWLVALGTELGEHRVELEGGTSGMVDGPFTALNILSAEDQ